MAKKRNRKKPRKGSRVTASPRQDKGRSQDRGTPVSPTPDSSEELIYNTIMNAPFEISPVITIANLLISTGISLGLPENTCVYTCLIMSEALAHYHINSQLEAVTVDIKTETAESRYGPKDDSWYIGRLFKGHSVLVIPELQRFIDPTAGQFDEVRDLGLARRPVMGTIPSGGNTLGYMPLPVARANLIMIYKPTPDARDAWQHPEHNDPKTKASIRQFGTDVADAALNLFREYRPDVITRSPHAGIRRFGIQ